MKKDVLVVIGTRPEAIKMAPVIHALKASRLLRPVVCATAQHRGMLDDVVRLFDLEIAEDLNLMRADQSLASLSAAILQAMDGVLGRHRPQALLVQGDTTTAMCSTLAAFYRSIPVGHVEAGLRTHRLDSPFPEEANRQVIARLARWHFTPTEPASRNLLAEGTAPESIFMTGNTVIDALRYAMGQLAADTPFRRAAEEELARVGLQAAELAAGGRNLILVTGHRRENFNGGLENTCRALVRLLADRPDCDVLFPAHPNPNVRRTLDAVVRHTPRFMVLPPLHYAGFVKLMVLSRMIISDSGGIQEEASSLGIPLLITRENTERPEALAGGTSVLTGTDPDRIHFEALKILASPPVVPALKTGPFGDGTSALHITQHLENLL